VAISKNRLKWRSCEQRGAEPQARDLAQPVAEMRAQPEGQPDRSPVMGDMRGDMADAPADFSDMPEALTGSMDDMTGPGDMAAGAR